MVVRPVAVPPVAVAVDLWVVRPGPSPRFHWVAVVRPVPACQYSPVDPGQCRMVRVLEWGCTELAVYHSEQIRVGIPHPVEA